MRTLIALLSLVALAGCEVKTYSSTGSDEDEPAATAATPPAGGVKPIGSGAAGGLTPVTGAESVGGGSGGGVGMAAKDMARRAAGTASGSETPPPADGE